jgi:3-hydroxy acid dehydrogenase / malonic semialdehyde reductase
MQKFSNKIVFITGASSGIGEACAEAFAHEGADLILAARRMEKLEQLKNKLSKKYSIKIKLIQLDVRDREAVKKAVNSLEDNWKKIEVLINNAGLARGLSKIHEGDIDNWEEMIDTNVKGLLYVTREVLPLMTAKESGHIINIGSTASHEVYPNGNVYCATKHAVKALTKAIRMDAVEKNIRVSTVDPGMVETEFSIVRFSGDSDKAKKVYEGFQPLTANDVADAVIYCASRPPHVNINEIIITPIAQASTVQVLRK